MKARVLRLGSTAIAGPTDRPAARRIRGIGRRNEDRGDQSAVCPNRQAFGTGVSLIEAEAFESALVPNTVVIDVVAEDEGLVADVA
jgi:hypothetical protein